MSKTPLEMKRMTIHRYKKNDDGYVAITHIIPDQDLDDTKCQEKSLWEDNNNFSGALNDEYEDFDLNEEESPEEFAAREHEAELRDMKMDDCIIRLKRVIEALEDVKMYTIMHPHIKEIRQSTPENIIALMDWADHWHALKTERKISPTLN